MNKKIKITIWALSIALVFSNVVWLCGYLYNTMVPVGKSFISTWWTEKEIQERIDEHPDIDAKTALLISDMYRLKDINERNIPIDKRWGLRNEPYTLTETDDCFIIYRGYVGMAIRKSDGGVIGVWTDE